MVNGLNYAGYLSQELRPYEPEPPLVAVFFG